MIENNIKGDIVEIGVWKGGSILSMMLTYQCFKSDSDTKFHLYDTFEGMTPPDLYDVDYRGNTASVLLSQNRATCICNLESVKKNISSNTNLIPIYHKGDILKNTFIPDKIAILRLDTDWYESTKYELDTFYNNVVTGGIVIIDDYGHWKGSKKAVDEFIFKNPSIKLNKIDYTGVFFFKN